MTMEMAVDIMRNLLQTALLLSVPILGTALAVGLIRELCAVYNQSAGANTHFCS